MGIRAAYSPYLCSAKTMRSSGCKVVLLECPQAARLPCCDSLERSTCCTASGGASQVTRVCPAQPIPRWARSQCTLSNPSHVGPRGAPRMPYLPSPRADEAAKETLHGGAGAAGNRNPEALRNCLWAAGQQLSSR
eukprot:351138-Chlamydomonas_euryale.AAC.9